ncbi:MAG TPA: NAD-dependent dihydropyrimidine dehydrogenase subunit PreA [Conexivisphaerales archaeon]|nr:NAD-dependent dihydropyrimidine dehydrogenase subunit PreA [Conexivisphaerales archaeon]
MAKPFEELKTSVAGVPLKNPFLLGSAPPTWDDEHIIRAAKLGWAGAVHKTIAIKETRDPDPRMYARKFLEDVISVQNIELITTYPKEQWAKWNKRIKAEAPSDFVLISSLMGTGDPSSWIEPLQVAQESGVDMVELNMSCPHGSPEHDMGAAIGQHPDLVGPLVRHVKKYSKVPVVVKLTPNVTSIVPIAKAALEGGADALTLTNTHGPVMSAVDVENMVPAPNVLGKGAFGGMSGPAVKPNTLRIVAEVAKAFPKADIFAIGGVEGWRDAMEFMSLGARAIQVVTGAMVHGYELVDDLSTGSRQFLMEGGYGAVTEVIGRALPNLVAHSDLSFEDWMRTWVNPAECIPCTRCVTTCSVVGMSAMKIDPVQLVARSDPDDCKGCGLCVGVCPTGAIKMLPEKEARERYQTVKAVYPKANYYYPETVEETIAALRRGGAVLKAGGTDLMLRMKQGLVAPTYVVDLKNVKGLSYIRSKEDAVLLGSSTTMKELAESRLLREKLSALPETAMKMSVPELRGISTLGGNLCNASPAADTAPVLLALDAKAKLVGPRGARSVPLASFFLGPGKTCLEQGEIITEVEVPLPPEGTGFSFVKAGRTYTDIAQVNVAAFVGTRGGVVDFCRIALGSVAPTPVRAKKAEAALLGKKLTVGGIKEAARAAVEEIKPISDSRGTAKQRRDSAELITRRALLQAGGLL